MNLCHGSIRRSFAERDVRLVGETYLDQKCEFAGVKQIAVGVVRVTNRTLKFGQNSLESAIYLLMDAAQNSGREVHGHKFDALKGSATEIFGKTSDAAHAHLQDLCHDVVPQTVESDPICAIFGRANYYTIPVHGIFPLTRTRSRTKEKS